MPKRFFGDGRLGEGLGERGPGGLERCRLGERWPVSEVCCAALRYGGDLEERKETLLVERDRKNREPWRLCDDDMERQPGGGRERWKEFR